MILHESLVDTDIPRRDKMREAVISHWRDSFEVLKLDLSVCMDFFFSFRFINYFGHRNHMGGLASLQTSGQMRT
jgi:hypothetical protein